LTFPPQLRAAWDRKGKGDSVLRAGIGLYCENVIYNNFFDRPYREKTGAFLAIRIASDGGQRSAESNI
jgi:hypothetical protein